ncbi:hypothetical protein BLA29_014088 [Euroglyphus maynei]|uniref:Uncharacterized protein n=1 Tax=Euroglyphus maynei TaxID=6958 RepID=A0A1Y3BER8_EURMA|nr:hypothetical protein BLA29_014088 [Euroglyphus maynei]
MFCELQGDRTLLGGYAHIKLSATEQIFINGAEHGGQTLFLTQRGAVGVVAQRGQRLRGGRDRGVSDIGGAGQGGAGGKQLRQKIRRDRRLA